jgi:hypothetical protein
MEITAFDPMKLSVTVGGRHMTGFAADGVFSLALNADGVTFVDGIQGDHMQILSAARSGILSLTFLPTSSSLRYIRQWAQNNSVLTVSVGDANPDDRKTVSCGGCRVQKVPDSNGSNTVSVNIIIPKVEWH